MIIKDEIFGECELQIYVDRLSTVDSYIVKAFSDTFDRDLTTEEVEDLDERNRDFIEEYAYKNGSLNHN